MCYTSLTYCIIYFFHNDNCYISVVLHITYLLYHIFLSQWQRLHKCCATHHLPTVSYISFTMTTVTWVLCYTSLTYCIIYFYHNDNCYISFVLHITYLLYHIFLPQWQLLHKYCATHHLPTVSYISFTMTTVT